MSCHGRQTGSNLRPTLKVKLQTTIVFLTNPRIQHTWIWLRANGCKNFVERGGLVVALLHGFMCRQSTPFRKAALSFFHTAGRPATRFCRRLPMPDSCSPPCVSLISRRREIRRPVRHVTKYHLYYYSSFRAALRNSHGWQCPTWDIFFYHEMMIGYKFPWPLKS